MRIPNSILLIIAFILPLQARAGEGFVQLDAGRGDARIPLYAMEHGQALATLVLLPGGDAGTGKIVDGKPGSGNFLSRARQLFFDEGFNVLVVFRASDLRQLDFAERIGKEHVAEIGNVVDYASRTYGKPVWLVGTSRGTVSATAAAIALGGGRIAGLVLTSSITSRKAGAIGSQDLDRIDVPTLVVHHKFDACQSCVPSQAAAIVDKLKNAPARKFILVEGGSSPQGDPCQAMHWHGYVNFEAQTVKLITDWIKDPAS
jgi:pimeloyl-ACP methyl ester carboxylesterase